VTRELVDVAIVGGGIAGLAAAYELSRRGASFVVLEASDRAGGVILSEEVDGFTIDAGPDSLLVQKPAAIALCQAIGLGDRLVSTSPPRLAYVLRNGRLHALPAGGVLGIPTTAGPFVRTRLFSTAGKLRMAAELFVPRRTDDSDESIGAFMTRRFGREATDYLAEPLLAGIHAGDVDRLSLQALFPRFVDAERRSGSLIRAFRHDARVAPRPAGAADGAFKSLPGGLSEMTCALVRQLGTDAIRLRSAVTAVDGHGPFRIDTAAGDRFEARAVVLATPAFVTASLLRDRDAQLASLCEEIPYASVATVALAFPRPAIAHPLNGSGFVVPRRETRDILAGSWLSSKWPHRAPEGFALLRTFIGGARDPRALDADDRELVARSMRALRPLLGIDGEPLFARVYRWNRANAQHEVGHAARLASIASRLERHPGLFLTGSGFRGVGIPDCIADGQQVAGTADENVKGKRQNAK
jgi:oxygen-dependent protoporphyrinogen oxidase